MADTALTVDDKEFDPSTGEARASQPWLNLLTDAEKKFRDWQDKADRIDELYADFNRQASITRDRQFAMFWANIQVLAPSVYARPPVPVVVPEFKDRSPIKRNASELLERSLKKSFSLDSIDDKMRLVRDDMLIVGRGVLWGRYETKADASRENSSQTKVERVCVDYIDRRDFLHEPARNWCDVGWVARRGWMTRSEVKERFGDTVTDSEMLGHIAYQVRKDGGRDSIPEPGSSPQEKAGIWEIWHKAENKVVWVVEGCPETLDEGEPHLRLEGFFPCPRPAYATVERRTLLPVPDIAYYRDQLEEINKLTNRIHALSDAIQVKGFYPAGGELGDAVETALNMYDDRKVMIPVASFAAFGDGGSPIVWLPLDLIANTIAGLIEMRRQIIDDVYQITGLSDVMRGATEAQETATAQQLKSQYGSIRIRDRQHELVRIARDMTVILGEIMAEHFSEETLLALSQMELPKRSDVQKQIDDIEKGIRAQVREAEKLAQSPEAQQLAQDNPEQAQEALQQLQDQVQQAVQAAEQQIAELSETVSIDDVMELLRDQKIRPFALDIETDSTIQPDEDSEKQRRAEFLQVFGSTLQQLAGLIEMQPGAAEFAGEVLKFALAPYRVGRELDGSIDKFVEQTTQRVQEDRPDPETEARQAETQAKLQEMQMKAQIEQQKAEAQMLMEQQKLEAEQQARAEDAQLKQQEMAAEAERKERELSAKLYADQQKHQIEIQRAQLDLQKANVEMDMLRMKMAAEQQKAALDARARTQDAAIREREAEVNEEMAFRQDERQAVATERMAASRDAGGNR